LQRPRLAGAVLVLSLLGGCAGAPHKPAATQPTPETIAAQAVSYLRGGRTQPALELLSKALQKHPDAPGLWKTLGLTLARMKRDRQADQAFRRALKLAPDDGSVHNDYGVFLCRGQYFDRARAQFKAATDNPRYATPQYAWTNLGICALRQDRAELARRGFRQALTSAPDFAPALYQMAKLEAGQGRARRATTYLKRLRQSGTQTPQSLSLCMSVYKRLDDFDQAGRCAQELYRQFPHSHEAQALLQ